MPEYERVNNKVSVDPDSHPVVIAAPNARHAAAIIGYLRDGVMAKHIPESAVRVHAHPASHTPPQRRAVPAPADKRGA